MYHDVGGIEYVVPIGNVLNVDEVDDAAVNEPIEDITGTSADDKTKTDKLVALYQLTEPQISDDCRQQADADKPKQPALTLKQAEDTPVIPYMGEMNQTVQLQCRIERNSVVHPIPDGLGKQQNGESYYAEQTQVLGSLV